MNGIKQEKVRALRRAFRQGRKKRQMKCTYCGHEETKVIETRESGSGLRRRRECGACDERFTTYERMELQPLRIIKKDGSREMFDREKAKKGMVLACEKRSVTADEIEQALDGVEEAMRKLAEPEVHTKAIGDLVMEQLRLLDEVAYIRFASVYKEFRDAKSFEKEIKVLTRGN